MNQGRWKLTNDEYEFIKGEVCFIFEKYKVKCKPVSGFEIASKMKITLIAYSGLSGKRLRKAMSVSEDGFFIEIEGHEYIFYNDVNRSYERQNWSILHEIGHIVLDHTGHSQHEEDEADFFAKYAIAPPILIHEIGADSPYDIHEAFNISFQAACYAYKYYLSWKRRYNHTKTLTDYEKRMLAVYKLSA